MAMRIKFGAQIIIHIWFRGFFSSSGRVSIYAQNIRCANKLARCKYENFVWSASPNCKLIALFALANGMFKMKMDIDRHGPRPDVKILTHLISRYHLPLSENCGTIPLSTRLFFHWQTPLTSSSISLGYFYLSWRQSCTRSRRDRRRATVSSCSCSTPEII